MSPEKVHNKSLVQYAFFPYPSQNRHDCFYIGREANRNAQIGVPKLILREKLFEIKSVFWVSLQRLPEIFVILRQVW
jgi:hypothetical protein